MQAMQVPAVPVPQFPFRLACARPGEFRFQVNQANEAEKVPEVCY